MVGERDDRTLPNYSHLMHAEIPDSKLVIERITEAPAVPGSLEFIADYADRFDYAIVSGSDQNELRQVCRGRGIDQYFRAIHGSPTEKIP